MTSPQKQKEKQNSLEGALKVSSLLLEKVCFLRAPSAAMLLIQEYSNTSRVTNKKMVKRESENLNNDLHLETAEISKDLFGNGSQKWIADTKNALN